MKTQTRLMLGAAVGCRPIRREVEGLKRIDPPRPRRDRGMPLMNAPNGRRCLRA